ncbi:hypothetical protein [Maridesulfovibrio hydrothermalis]|uniref:Uncharacterized protein n=1 Tax=Maridesulfovibrio hydrothermalis AM13 = DSM 14728 TaxID=1121451 RepID=L0RHR2_9BACT|nr:hypothetical protein [Maridesulfovibrio hydrothermalis]CCO25126.1 conserved exported protein of unknown function [Maridesulfovibrio hydrothermalis AM13 = DSM 14728]
MRKTILLLVALLSLFVIPPLVQASDLPRLMIVGEDSDTDTIPRNNRVFKRVLNAVSNEMVNRGFDVKDETALTHMTHVQGRTRRNDAELIQIAKDAGIDVLVIFSIYPNVKQNQNSVRATARVEGRMLSVWDGSRMGNFESEPQQYQLVPSPYSRNDVLESVGKMSKIIGADVAAVLADRLEGYYPEGDGGGSGGGSGGVSSAGRIEEWTLIFDGFTDDDMLDVEDYVTIFTGYDSHRPKTNALNTSSHHELWYKSSIDSAHLKRNMVRMLRKMNMKGRVYISGRELKIVKQHRVKQRKKQSNDGW